MAQLNSQSRRFEDVPMQKTVFPVGPQRESESPHRATVVAILAETLLDLLVPGPGVAAGRRKALKSRSQPALVSTGGGKRTRTRLGR